jgi:hypothetical protein
VCGGNPEVGRWTCRWRGLSDSCREIPIAPANPARPARPRDQGRKVATPRPGDPQVPHLHRSAHRVLPHHVRPAIARLSQTPLQVGTLVSQLDLELDQDDDLSLALIPEVWNVAREGLLEAEALERVTHLLGGGHDLAC